METADGTFDLLRAKVEGDVPNPAIIAVTSSTHEDGRDVVARELASSLAATGYSTMLILAGDSKSGAPKTADTLPLDEIGRRELASASTSKLALVSIGDAVQRSTNQRHIKDAFELFREKFDYVVISAGFESQANPFASTVIGVANAVLVSVKQGRRKSRVDARLSVQLNRLGSRFLGLVAMTKSTIEASTAALSVRPSPTSEAWRTPMTSVEKSSTRREVAEWPT
jgi:Mrp family chromosome partitioning ATPase